MALLPEFKSNPAGLVIREYTVIQAAPIRQGKVGALIGQDGKSYAGGGDQIEFLFERGTKQDPEWEFYLKKGKHVKLKE